MFGFGVSPNNFLPKEAKITQHHPLVGKLIDAIRFADLEQVKEILNSSKTDATLAFGWINIPYVANIDGRRT